VIKRFSKQVEHILDPEGHWREGSTSHDWDEGRRPAPPTLVKSKRPKEHEDQDKRGQFNWFRMQAFDLLSEVTDRIDELEGLKKSAESTAQSVSLERARQVVRTLTDICPRLTIYWPSSSSKQALCKPGNR
jgi:hypothetical protein